MARLRRAFLTSIAGLALFSGACVSDRGEEARDGEHASDQALDAHDLPAKHKVAEYRAVPLQARTLRTALPPSAFSPEFPAEHEVVVLRELTLDGTPTFLVADGTTMRTGLVSASTLEEHSSPVPRDSVPFAQRLAEAQRGESALRSVQASDDGSLHVAVTVDMCQSSRPWEKRLFDWLVSASLHGGRPVEVGIAMTGRWANTHPHELGQLATWQREGKLNITWIDHSYTHPLNCSDDAQGPCTFLTAPTVDFQSEVLKTEALLISQGLLPSALFRFPGLVHDHARRSELSNFSLFALDADAWLAKGEPIHDRAVVLVHGNGNEPKGIDLFLAAMEKHDWLDGLRSGTKAFVSPLRAIDERAR